MADNSEIIELTNRVKLAVLAVAQANERARVTEVAYYTAREEKSEAGATLATAEKALLKAARAA